MRIRITVLKRTVNEELGRYLASEVRPCPVLKDGSVFETTLEKPEGFCDWAWMDIHPYVATLMGGGSFSEGIFQGWMKDKDSMIACCTDGVRPVVFELKRIP